jgi:AcrR family transcriptional regulator
VNTVAGVAEATAATAKMKDRKPHEARRNQDRRSHSAMRTNVVDMVEPASSRNRSPYQNTALSLMRTGVLDAMHGLLLERKWSSITMADVSAAAGISRGTLYNEFRSRMGLARSYALRLADGIITGMETAVYAHPGDGYGALQSAFRDFFNRIDSDPLVRVLRTEDAPNDLLRMITVESQFIVDHALEQLSGTFQRSWVSANQHDADVLGHAIVRASLSFLALPPISADDAATAIAQLLAPYIEAIRTPS